MKSGSHNIYDTGSKDRGYNQLLPPGVTQPIVDAWATEQNRRRRNTVLFGLSVLLFIVLLGIVLVQQYLLNTNIRLDPENSRPATLEEVESSHLRALDFGTSPQAELVLDELTEVTPMEIPEEGDLPLDTQWIKQAAYYVVLAEKAYKDNRLQVALENYQKALTIYPDLQGVHRYKGLIYLQMQEYAAAAEAFEKSKTSDAMSHGVLNNLGVSHLALKEYDKAEGYFLRALRQKPDYALAYLNMATLHVRAGNKEKAAQYFKEYLVRKPSDLKAAQAYATVLMDIGEWAAAAKLLEEIRQQAPELAPVYFRLAQALSNLNQSEGAVITLRRGALLVDPKKALGWLSRAEFDRLRDNSQFQALIAELSAPGE